MLTKISNITFILNLLIILIFSQSVSLSNITDESTISYQFPEFYKGIYLNYESATNIDILQSFITQSNKSGINTFVLDVQPSIDNACPISDKNLDLIYENNIHPVARIVCFDQGLRKLPLSEEKIESIYSLAESCAEKGFHEIQFDYIRFADTQYTNYYGKSVILSPEQKYEFIRNFLQGARSELSEYNVKIAADIFGRIPWKAKNSHDVIGQKVENFDEVCDVICPMAYPSHYWYDKASGKNYKYLPYETVYITSKKAREKTNNAIIVSYIQAFQIKIKKSGFNYNDYIKEQIRACHDAGISGFILWNARQDYETPFTAVSSFYENMYKYPDFNYSQFKRKGL